MRPSKLANLECSANIFSTGKPDVASFYEMWEAVTAISDVCTRYRQAGSARGLGMFLRNFTEHCRRTLTDIPAQANMGIYLSQ